MKEKINIIGFGYNVKKNIIPSILNINKNFINKIYVRKKYKNYPFTLDSIKKISYLKKNSWIYISTPNQSHYLLVKKCLNLGHNIICEKPLTLEASKTSELFLLAKKKNLKLFEVDMYKYHTTYLLFKKIFKSKINKVEELILTFKIPKLEKKNFIYDFKRGGGATYNLGYYPISCFVDLFSNFKINKSNLLKSKKKKIDISGFCEFKHKNVNCKGNWSINQKYINQAIIKLKNNKSYVIKMFFSKSITVNPCLIFKNKNKIVWKKKLPKDNQFYNMIKYFMISKKKNNSKDSLKIIEYLKEIKKNKNI